MKFEAVIFDMDGTLADTIPLTVYALQETILKYTGRQYSDQEILDHFGPTEINILKDFVRENQIEEALELYVECFSENFTRFIKPMEGIQDLLGYLQSQEIKIGLFTGRSERVTKIILDRLGILGYFKTVITGDHTKEFKPDPEGVKLALKNLHTDPSRSIYAGDYDVDILASKAAGTTSVLVLWSSTASEDPLDLEPDQAFRTPFQFIDWLKTQQ